MSAGHYPCSNCRGTGVEPNGRSCIVCSGGVIPECRCPGRCPTHPQHTPQR